MKYQGIEKRKARKRPTDVQGLKDFYSAYYKQSLSNVLAQDCSEMQDPEILKTVQNLNDDQSEQFWNHLQSIVIPEKTVKDLKYYFSLRYQVVMYSECLNYSGGPSKCFFELGRRMKFII
ncbi:Hypothetical_protein [Hexamita inflata]|uniref:Hypothetical_protein n=1 Tax=Hexamita inflata TaxID=28002 RepID=A0AA86RMC6_9EUKA|nr:Hypothetical protein HINF_LOCUS63863 [Hexamita inflata]